MSARQLPTASRRRRSGYTLRVLMGIAALLVAVYFGATSLDGSSPALGPDPALDQTSEPTGDPGGDLTAKQAGDATGSQQGPAAPAVDPVAAAAQLATLPVKGRAAKTGYGRESQFGPAWYDLDGNGCKTRNDVLARDLTVTRLAENGCVVLAGSFVDPYTGTYIEFQHGERTSALVQIDHVVALSDAWQKGAQQIGAEQRLALANDPLNLLAVDGPTNSAKSDADAATWLPPNTAFRCEYVSRQIEVKAKYGLWVTPAEHDAMARVLAAC